MALYIPVIQPSGTLQSGDQMKTGDLFFLNVLGEKLAYQVDQIVTVTPDRTDLLRIEEGKDQVTLVTCTPYGINSHRLLVRGKRIPYREAQKRAEQAKKFGFLIWGKRVFVLSILFLGAAGFWLLKPSKRQENCIMVSAFQLVQQPQLILV